MTFLYILLHIRKPNKAAKHDTQKAADHQAMQTIRPFGKITKYAIILDYEHSLKREHNNRENGTYSATCAVCVILEDYDDLTISRPVCRGNEASCLPALQRGKIHYALRDRFFGDRLSSLCPHALSEIP